MKTSWLIERVRAATSSAARSWTCPWQPPTQTCYRPFQMHGSVEEHIGAATLVDYSVQELGPEALEAAECHLLICAACQKRLAGIEPFNTVHYTKDGLFYSRITQLRDGSFAAHHWGCQIEGGGRYPDLAAACKYLVDSFAQMFPEHECVEGCGDTTPSQTAQHWVS